MGRYNGCYMRSFKILPVVSLSRVATLSKDALRRLEWMDWYFIHGQNAESTCRHFSLSKSVFYRWLHRFNKYNLSTLEFDTATRRPLHTRQMTTPQSTTQLVCDIRSADPEKSKYEIQAELRQKYGIKIGYNTIQKIINRHAYLLAGSKRYRTKSRKYKIARVRAAWELKDKALGSLVQVDTKHLYILGIRFYVFAAVDCKSRYAYTYAYTSISSRSAQDFLSRVQSHFPFPVAAINTDNGSEYLLYFHRLTESLGIPHYFSRPRTPTMNSRVERLIQTLEYEFLAYQELLPEIAQVRKLCEHFNTKYNQERYHRALKYQTPYQYVTLHQEKGVQSFSI